MTLRPTRNTPEVAGRHVRLLHEVVVSIWLLMAPVAVLATDSALAADPLDSPSWHDVREKLGLSALVFDSSIEVLAPASAEDPLNVPVSIRMDTLPDIKRVLVVADLNPILRVLEFEPLQSARRLSFRMKLQQGSPIRALAQTTDGVWHAGGVWVETAGGGCTAPSVGRSTGNWSDTLGKVDSRQIPQASGTRLKLRIMHPMDTGLAPGIPAFYLETLTLRDANGTDWARLKVYEPVSENPVFSIDFVKPTPELRLIGQDNNGNRIDSVIAP